MDDFINNEDPGEAAREQARTPGNAHRRRLLNALLAAWDAHPEWTLEALLRSSSSNRACPLSTKPEPFPLDATHHPG